VKRVRLRATEIADLDFVVGLEAEPAVSRYIDSWPRAGHLETMADPGRGHLIAESDGERVGFVIIDGIADAPSVEIKRIAISTRGEGFGRATLLAAIAWITPLRRGRRIWLDVYGDNIVARGLYASAGFVETSSSLTSSQRPIVVMQLADDGSRSGAARCARPGTGDNRQVQSGDPRTRAQQAAEVCP
jgi:diamine N-acetyltransferase